MAIEPHNKYTNSALRPGQRDSYPQRRVGEFAGAVVSNDWVNKEYKLVVLKVHEHALKAYAGQMFHLLCPSPDGAEVWMRRPMSVYRVDKAAGQVEFLYKVEGRARAAWRILRPGDDFNIAGPLGVGFKLELGWKNIVVLGRGVGLATLAPLSRLAAEAGVGVTAVLSARHAGVLMSKDLFDGLRARTITVLDPGRQQRGRKCRKPPRGYDQAGEGRCVLHMRLQPSVEAYAAAGKETWRSGTGRHGANNGMRIRRLLRLHAHLHG